MPNSVLKFMAAMRLHVKYITLHALVCEKMYKFGENRQPSGHQESREESGHELLSSSGLPDAEKEIRQISLRKVARYLSFYNDFYRCKL